MKTLLTTAVIAATTSLALAGDVNPDIIMGTGIGNGSFTIASASGIELGLRAKRRYNLAGVSDGVNNWDGVDTYTFNPANGNPPADRAMWNFEFSINSDVNGTTGNNLNDFNYQLSMFQVNADGTNPADALTWDIINGADPRHGFTIYDHSIGDNTTTAATDSIAVSLADYANLIDNNNVAQNSWNYGFFNDPGTGILEGIDPAAVGSYIIRLTAFDKITGLEIVSESITVNVVPLPTAAWAGLGMLGAFAGIRTIRRRA